MLRLLSRFLPALVWLAPLAVATLCEHARADDSRMRLQWQAPKGCPTEQAVRHAVESWLAQSQDASDLSGIGVDAKVARTKDGYALELTLATPSGSAHEQLHAERCDTLAGVVALKVALAADPAAWFNATQSDAQAHNHWGLRLSAGLGQGVQPGLGPTLELTGSLRFTRVAFELGAGYGFQNAARYEDHPSVGADLDMFYGTARACALPDMGTIEFPLCAGADVGLMRGHGFGLTTVSTSVQPFVDLVIGPALRIPLRSWSSGSFSLWFGLEALVALVRPGYHVRNLGPLFAPDSIGARVQAGTELHFD